MMIVRCSGTVSDLPYRIEMWDDRDTRVEELVGLAVGDNAVARDPSRERLSGDQAEGAQLIRRCSLKVHEPLQGG